jgi:hypothetical protein
MEYIIHACPQRMWYVDGFLIPSLKEQGISNILVWNDTEGKGNLLQCMESFRECGKKDGATWHIQDDVVICRDFAERTSNLDGVVCGFCCKHFEATPNHKGMVVPQLMWWSFQCIQIPNRLAGECADWFFNEAVNDKNYEGKISLKKYDDFFFREFMLLKHSDMLVMNLVPNLVDHIDYMVGGTLINKHRTQSETRSYYFQDKDLVDELRIKIMEARNGRT